MRTIGICDDNRYDIELLSKVIDRVYQNPHRILSYTSGRELLEDSNVGHDLLFIDMQMNGLNGLETARKLREANPKAVLVFWTGKAKPKFDDFDVNVFRYLTKNTDEGTLEKRVREICAEMERRSEKNLFWAKCGSGNIKLAMDDVLYIKRIRNGSEFYLHSSAGQDHKRVTTDKKLDYYAQEWKSKGFFMIHNSIVINCKYVKNYNSLFVQMMEGKQLSIARGKYRAFCKEVADYYEAQFEAQGEVRDIV